MSRHLTKEDTQMPNKNKKRCSLSYVTREMQIKTIKYHCTHLKRSQLHYLTRQIPIRTKQNTMVHGSLAKIKMSINHCGDGVQRRWYNQLV